MLRRRRKSFGAHFLCTVIWKSHLSILFVFLIQYPWSLASAIASATPHWLHLKWLRIYSQVIVLYDRIYTRTYVCTYTYVYTQLMCELHIWHHRRRLIKTYTTLDNWILAQELFFPLMDINNSNTFVQLQVFSSRTDKKHTLTWIIQQNY